MKILLAPDSFKNNMRSSEVCSILAEAFNDVSNEFEIVSVPMADGGEGTVDSTVKASGGKTVQTYVQGPLGTNLKAEYGLLGNSETAVMEMASASGLELIKENERNPLKTSTYGTGQLILEIINSGIKDIVIGVGGSATVDGGAGMAQALGYKLLDKNGKEIQKGGGELRKLKTIDKSNVNHQLSDIKIRVACDVKNPLLGKNGAAAVFGPQKGAAPKMISKLEKGLSKLSDILIEQKYLENSDSPGDGAAGGLGFGLRAFCAAEMISGTELIMSINGFKKKLNEADYLITGEGCSDSQTSRGKLCSVLAETASLTDVPVILLSGSLQGNIKDFYEFFDVSFSLCTDASSVDEAIKMSKKNLYHYGRNIAELLKPKSH